MEAPFPFFEKPVKALLLDPVETSHMAFGLVPEILYAVDVIFLIGEELGMIDPQVVKV